MMSWIRTGTSLITFGFTIYNFFQLDTVSEKRRDYLIGPREFAIALVSIGPFSLLLATLKPPEHPGARNPIRGQAAISGRHRSGVGLAPRRGCIYRNDLSSIARGSETPAQCRSPD